MKKLIFSITLMFFFLNGFSQEIKITQADKEIETSFIAMSSDQIFTDAGNFRFSEIEKITFKAYDINRLSIYNDLLQKIPVEFQDGFKLDTKSIDSEMQAYNMRLVTGSDQYLIQAANNALIGIAIPLVGIGVMYLTDIPAIGIASGIIGSGLIVVAWIKIRKAGQALKQEKKSNISR
jgi:hypothetical protein